MWWVFSQPALQPSARAACVLLLDRSGSTFDEVNIARYESAAEAAIRGCAERSAVLDIYEMTGGPSRPVRIAGPISFFDPDETKDALLDVTLEERVAEARDVISRALSTPPPAPGQGGSEIVLAMAEAARGLDLEADAFSVDDRFLIVLTDGLQTPRRGGPGISVFGIFDGATTAEELGGTAADQLPDGFAGTTVNMVGVSAGVSGGDTPLSSGQEQLLEDFWTSVVTTAGGSLCFYGADPPLLPVSC